MTLIERSIQRVPAVSVPGATFAGGSPTFASHPRTLERHLDRAAIISQLAVAPTPYRATLLDAVLDESGSMWSRNDAFLHRREALLIAIEHLCGRGRRSTLWHCRITTFDLSSPLDMPIVQLDRRGLRSVEHRLLTAGAGGSSVLGPALERVEAQGFNGDRLLIVLSDFELYDPNPAQAIEDFASSPAHGLLAIVFRSSAPRALVDSRVVACSVDPRSATPADIARAIVDAARRLEGAR
jgi:hypothetical protein